MLLYSRHMTMNSCEQVQDDVKKRFVYFVPMLGVLHAEHALRGLGRVSVIIAKSQRRLAKGAAPGPSLCVALIRRPRDRFCLACIPFLLRSFALHESSSATAGERTW